MYTARSVRKENEKSNSDLLQYIALQEEVHKTRDQQWSAEYTKLFDAYQQLDKETVERDYEEFKAPDTDGDDRISRLEFNTYVRKYLSSFPELSEKDFPKFEEFDLDGDGSVSFDEWQQFLVIQKQQEANKAKLEANGGKNSVYNELLSALYDTSSTADNFGSLQKNLDSGSKGKREAEKPRKSTRKVIGY